MRYTPRLMFVLAATAVAACSSDGSRTTGPQTAGTKASVTGTTGHGGGSPADSAARASQQLGIYGQVVAPIATTAAGDSTGAMTLIAGAQVAIVRMNSAGVVATGKTDTAGLFSFQNVADGTYSVQATPPSGSPYGPARVDGVEVRNGIVTLDTHFVLVVLPHGS